MSALNRQRVVVTGMGAVTAAGPTTSHLRAGLHGDVTQIHTVSLFSTEGLRVHIAGQVEELRDPALLVGAGRCRASRSDRLALLALEEALAGSHLELASVERERIGVAIGSSSGGMLETESFYETRLRNTRSGRLRSQLLSATVGAPDDLVATAIGALGPRFAPSTACSSGAIAIAMGMHWVRQGRADVVIAGGADALCRMTFTGFHALQALSPEPCRPFDRHRRGLSLGEGAGVLVLESESHARSRGASILGEIAGAGLSCDAAHTTAPHGESRGAVQALSLALEDAGVDPGEIAYVNAHGTGTAHNDAAEAQAIARVCGAATGRTVVSSSKGLIGHLLGAAGAVEAIVILLAMLDAFVPPTVGLTEPDPAACDLDLVMGTGRAQSIPIAASNSYGFGGNNCTLIFRAA